MSLRYSYGATGNKLQGIFNKVPHEAYCQSLDDLASSESSFNIAWYEEGFGV